MFRCNANATPSKTTKNKHISSFHALNLWSVGFVCVRMHNSLVTCSGRRSRIWTMTIAYGTVSALAILPNIYWAFIIQIWKWMCFPLRGAVFWYVSHFAIFLSMLNPMVTKNISYLSVAASVKILSFINWMANTLGTCRSVDCAWSGFRSHEQKKSILWFQSISMHINFFRLHAPVKFWCALTDTIVVLSSVFTIYLFHSRRCCCTLCQYAMLEFTQLFHRGEQRLNQCEMGKHGAVHKYNIIKLSTWNRYNYIWQCI